jgi:hypothetical protein
MAPIVADEKEKSVAAMNNADPFLSAFICAICG